MAKMIVGVLPLVLLAVIMAAEAGEAAKPGFAPGQMWSIKSELPNTTKIIVGRVEAWNRTIAVHVSMVDVPIPAGVPDAGQTMRIEHAPFEQSALTASVDHLIGTGVPPNSGFESCYDEWRTAQGGIYTISVQEALAAMFETLARGR